MIASIETDSVSVLMVEDNPGDAHLMRALLEEAAPGRYQITHLQRLKDVAPALAESTPDLILLDLNLPDSAGLETARAVTAISGSIPVVVLTGLADELLRQEGMKLGLQDFLPKDLPSPAHLARSLEHAVERAALSRELMRLNDTLRAIRGVSHLIAREHDAQALIEKACETLVETRGWSGAWIALLDEEGKLCARAEYAMDNMEGVFADIEQGRLPSCMRTALEQTGVIGIDDIHADCPSCPGRPAHEGQGALGARLAHGDRVYGFLNLAAPAAAAVTDEQLQLLDETANDIALALHKIDADRQRAEAEQTVAHQARLLDRVSEAIVSTDMEHRVRSWNRAAERIYGWTAEEAIGRSTLELTEAEYATTTPEEALRQLYAVGTWAGELHQKRRDGTPLDVLASVTLLRDAAGEPIGAVAVNRDITRVRRDEAALHESEETYRTLVETLPDGVALTELDGTILKVNQRLVNMLGFDAHASLVGAQLVALVSPAHQERAETNLLLTVESGTLKDVEYEMVRADGGRFPVELSASLLRDADDQPHLFVCILRDISERKRVQTQLAQSDRMASVGMLAAGVAHEINNPLAYILGNLEGAVQDIKLLTEALTAMRERALSGLGGARAIELFGSTLSTPDEETLEEVVAETGDALRGAWRVRDIVRDLKVFSRVEAEKKSEPLGVNAVVEGAISLAYNEIKYRARLVKELGRVPLVLANEGRLSQVFLNLLINAAQAIDEGAVANNEIRVSSRAEGGEVVVEVRDTGTGISPEQLRHVFEAFFTTKPAGIGSGLGLAICRSIVSEHGGTIGVESEVGKGTAITVRLPAAAAVDHGSDEHEAAEDVELPEGGRLLVVDDDPLVGAFLSRTLGRRFDVVLVDSGAAARELLADDRDFDVVLCDVMMPDTTGVDLVEWLGGAHPELANRVVFMTGGVFTEKAKTYLEGCDHPTLEKPFDPVKLRLEIRRILEQVAS